MARDGSLFKAHAREASLLMKWALARALERLEADIEASCPALEAHDPQERGRDEALGAEPALPAELEKLKAPQERRPAQLKAREASGEKPLSRTDPEARALRKRAPQVSGDTVPSPIDAQHRRLLDPEVTNAGKDSEPLAEPSRAAHEVRGGDARSGSGPMPAPSASSQ